jgi:hypothetical protein
MGRVILVATFIAGGGSTWGNSEALVFQLALL